MRGVVLAAVSTIGVVVLAAGCGGGARSAEPVSKGSCGPLQYHGPGKPQYVIVSDLPLRAPPGAREQVAGIEYVLKQRGYQAGKYRIGYQSCDDSSASVGAYDNGVCTANAKAYATDTDVLGVIGPYNSGCAADEIPIADSATKGPLAMIGTATTDPELTAAVPGGSTGTPDVYYPTHIRNFVRLTAPDQFQGAAAALLAKQHALRRVFVLDDGEGYGRAVAGWFTGAARRLGIGVAGKATWNPKARGYASLAAQVAGAHPDGVYLSGYDFLNGGKVLKALRSRLGAGVVIFAPDGFADPNEDVHDAGKAANGLLVTLAGVPDRDAGPAGKAILKATGPEQPEQYGALYGAAGASVLLDAIASSNGTRQSVSQSLFETSTPAGIIGKFGFDPQGDPTIGAMTVLHIVDGKPTFAKTLYPTGLLAKGPVSRA